MSQKLKPETLPVEILNAITYAEKAMLLAKRTAEACNNNSARVEKAQKEHDVAAEALAKAEVDAELYLDENERSKLEKEVTKLTECLSEKQRNIDRIKRVAEALHIKRTEIDTDVRIARENFEAAIEFEHRKQVTKITEEIKESITGISGTPLLAVLRRAYALQSSLPSRELGLALSQMVVSNPVDFRNHLVEGDRTILDGRMVSLTNWHDDESACEIHQRFLPVLQARQLLGRHQSYIMNQKSTSSGYTTGGNLKAYSDTMRSGNPSESQPHAESRLNLPFQSYSYEQK